MTADDPCGRAAPGGLGDGSARGVTTTVAPGLSVGTPLPYGAWPSPFSARSAVADRVGLSEIDMGPDGSVWWAETRPADGGRTVIVRYAQDSVTDMVAAGWSVRSRVHEYGGGAWRLIGDQFVFSEDRDGRVYRSDVHRAEPVPLTPPPSAPRLDRYADFAPLPDGSAVIGVRERHRAGTVTRDLVRIPMDGSKAGSEQRLDVVYQASGFVGSPRVSPDGDRMAFITWDHPRMPWDGTELRIMELDRPDSARVLAGSSTESLMQPQWAPNGELFVVSDRTGWWNLYRLGDEGLVPVCPRDEEFGEPAWVFGLVGYVVLDHRRLLVRHGTAERRLGTVDLDTGTLEDLSLPYRQVAPTFAASADRVALVGESQVGLTSVALVDLPSGTVRTLRTAGESLESTEWAPTGRTARIPSSGERRVPVRVYPPTSPLATGPSDARPPWTVFVHGGPTASGLTDLATISYFTSRGIGVVEVDYAGSTGWGRAYREALRNQWGVADVEDCIAAARWLISEQLADPGRIAIRGGSAGGWTVLCALAESDVFGAGVSYYGVADALSLADETHDFESRYLETLIGPLPQFRQRYEQRSPLSRSRDISVPVLLLHGADDAVVPPAQTEALAATLHANNVRHAYLAFEGEGHGFRRADSRIAALEAELSFYGQVFGFKPPGVERLLAARRLATPTSRPGSATSRTEQ